MELFLLFGWLTLALVVGYVGSQRKIGFGWAFFWAILLSPLIGFIIAIVSTPNYINELKTSAKPTNTNTVDELTKLVALKEKGVLADEQFEQEKQRVLKQMEPVKPAAVAAPYKPTAIERFMEKYVFWVVGIMFGLIVLFFVVLKFITIL